MYGVRLNVFTNVKQVESIISLGMLQFAVYFKAQPCLGINLKSCQLNSERKTELWKRRKKCIYIHGQINELIRYKRIFLFVAAARLMHKYNAHGATDVTGFGLLGHAQNLARIQKNEVGFVIHNLPIIAKMAAVSKACGNMFGLLQGHSAETSGTFESTRAIRRFWTAPQVIAT